MDMIISAVDSPDRPAILDIVWMGSVVQWSSQSKAPVLAIDPPMEGGHIPAKWSVSVGLPLPLTTKCGKMYLVDLSIPRPVYKEHGIKYQSPFGHKFMMALHPKEEWEVKDMGKGQGQGRVMYEMCYLWLCLWYYWKCY